MPTFQRLTSGRGQVGSLQSKGDVEVEGDLLTESGIGAAAGTGVTAEEFGDGSLHKTVLTFLNTPVTLADNAGVIAYGSQKIYDFPAGVIRILGASSNLAVTKSSAGVNANWDGDFSIGSGAANNGASLTGAEANVIPSTATPQASSGATTAKGSSFSSITALTDNSGGTGNDTLEALPALTDSPASADDLRDDIVANLVPALKNNYADLAAKVNEIIAALTGTKQATLDGSSTAIDLFFNILVDDADHNVGGTACNLILNGTVTFVWSNLGDF